jgi:hypothetical protein
VRNLELEIGRRYRGRVLRVHPSRKPSNVFSRGRGQTTTTIRDRDSANPEANDDYSLIKSGQLFIRTHNETLTVAAMCVCNPDCSLFGING